MFRDGFRFAPAPTPILLTSISPATNAHPHAALSGHRFRRRRILVGSAQTCQGRRPSLGRANGDAGMTHLVFRVDRQRSPCGTAKATG